MPVITKAQIVNDQVTHLKSYVHNIKFGTAMVYPPGFFGDKPMEQDAFDKNFPEPYKWRVSYTETDFVRNQHLYPKEFATTSMREGPEFTCIQHSRWPMAFVECSYREKHSAIEYGMPLISSWVGWMLSGFLQLGETISLRNYRNYNLGDRPSLKFMPLMIGHNDFEFFIYFDNFESIGDTILKGKANFQKALGIIEDLDLKDAIQKVSDLLALEGIAMRSPDLKNAHREQKQRVHEFLAPYRAKLSFLLADVPGPKDVYAFPDGWGPPV